MQTFGFHILAYQGQDAKTQGQLLGRCHIVFCVIEGWTHVSYVAAQAFAR